jgi:hypothetical protein
MSRGVKTVKAPNVKIIRLQDPPSGDLVLVTAKERTLNQAETAFRTLCWAGTDTKNSGLLTAKLKDIRK